MGEWDQLYYKTAVSNSNITVKQVKNSSLNNDCIIQFLYTLIYVRIFGQMKGHNHSFTSNETINEGL